MKLLIIMILSISNTLFASPERICAYDSARAHKPYVEQIQSTDKHKHCTISGAVGIDCGATQSVILGIAKEVWDAMGNGTPELADLKANIKGIKLSRREDVQNLYDCENICFNHYDK